MAYPAKVFDPTEIRLTSSAECMAGGSAPCAAVDNDRKRRQASFATCIATRSASARTPISMVAMVSEYWSGHGFGRNRDVATVDNTVAGPRRRIRVEYVEAHSPARLELHWTQPNGASGIVPGDKLFPRYGLPTRTVAHDATRGPRPR
jgi:hypothetical protein